MVIPTRQAELGGIADTCRKDRSQPSVVWTYFLRKLELALVSVLSVRSSRSVVEEPQERPRVSLPWLLRSRLGAGVVADPAVACAAAVLLLPPLLPTAPAAAPQLWWMGRDSGWLWLWFCSGVSDPGVRGVRSCLRSWFSWLTRSSWPSSSSMRRRWVSKSLAWLSIILFSSRRYSTARLGLSGLDSMAGALPLGVGEPPATVLDPVGQRSTLPTSPNELGGGRDRQSLCQRLTMDFGRPETGSWWGKEVEGFRVPTSRQRWGQKWALKHVSGNKKYCTQSWKWIPWHQWLYGFLESFWRGHGAPRWSFLVDQIRSNSGGRSVKSKYCLIEPNLTFLALGAFE